MYLLCCCSPDSKSENLTSGKQVSPLTPSLPRAPVPVLPAEAQHSKDRSPDLDIVPWEKQRHNLNNALTEFLNKIKKRLSGGVNFNGSHSSCSKRMSEAELARRAELKRIRTRRIQEELKANSTLPQQQYRGEVSVPSLQNPSRSLGPRDAIEFTINSDSLEPIVDDSQSFTSSAQIEKRRNSFPAVEQSVLELRLPRKTISLNFASAYSDELPVSPETAHLPPPSQIKGCLEPSPTFDAVVGPGNCFSATFDDASWDRQSGLSLWLLSQSMPSGDTRSPSPVETRHDDAAIYAMNRSLSLTALNTIDSIVEMPLPMWDGLAHSSMGRHSQQTASVLAHEPVPSNLSLHMSVEKDHALNAGGFDQQKDTTEIITHHSAVNSSGDTSGTTTPPAEHILSPDDLRTLELSPFHWHDTASVFRVSEKSGSQSSYATAAEILEAPRLHDEIGLATDGSRMKVILQSHRASLEYRELELQSVAKRFSEKTAHLKTWHSRTSRFLEDFSSIGPTTNTKRRLSSLFKFNPSSEASYTEAKDGISQLELPPLQRTRHHVGQHARKNTLPLSGRIEGFRSISMPAAFSAAVMTSLRATTPQERGNETVTGEGAQQTS